jgi:hypothetical protein
MMWLIEVLPMSPEARIDALRNAPPDGWVALSEDEQRLVAYGPTYDEVVQKSRENGVTEAVVVKVPENWNDLALWN